MKEFSLKYITQRYVSVSTMVHDYEASLAVGRRLLASDPNFTQENITVLETRLADYKQQQFELKQCLDWLNTL